jgi:hypothetical protein
MMRIYQHYYLLRHRNSIPFCSAKISIAVYQAEFVGIHIAITVLIRS